MAEHCCGPTREQVNDAMMRGEVMGTWPRCEACAAKEAALLDKIEFRKIPDPDAHPSWCKCQRVCGGDQ